ncbi:TPA: hypothetical protein HA242_05985 [Candidatus Woesearchaeota archaeon]|nr:hypothetical protein [Candidatus Woesearchaeota archaeon]HIG93098.1 hypothetical protein [Candidatus Woesearchaeota archaeon]HIH13246.1 hypothetical protein [Candidatus Woesearchaeota archaeon]
MKHFAEFVENGVIKRQTPNIERALSLIKEAEEKKQFLSICVKSIPPEKMNANFIVDYCYDILLELIRARMLKDGFNAGNSHEAEVSYLRNINFSEGNVVFLNEMRYFRNGTKYYGTILIPAYAQKVLEFMNKIYPKLQELAKGV